MIPVGFDIMMVARFLAGLGIVAGLWYVADQIGDAREAKVWSKINSAIEKANSEIDAQLDLDEKITQIAERARQKALVDARAIPAPAQCVASPEQAAALTAIK